MTDAANLLQLQELDLDIERCERALDELPEKRAILEARTKRREVEELGRKADLLLAKLEAELRRTQDETTVMDEKIQAEQSKIMSGQINDHKQVQHISRELDALKRRKDKLETDSLKTMERIEHATAQKAKIVDALGQLEQREASLIARFQEHGGELQSRIAEETRRRADLVAILDPSLLARYESLREQKAGIGIGRLDGERCTACRVVLPAGAVSALLGGADIGVCPQCHRLIVVREEPES